MKKYSFLTLFMVITVCLSSAIYSQQTSIERDEIKKQLLKNQIDDILEEKTGRKPDNSAFKSNTFKSAKSHKKSVPKLLESGIRELSISDELYPESEIHSVLNPKDTNNIIVSGILYDVNEMSITCPVYYTKDFGKTWIKSNFDAAPQYKYFKLACGGDPIFTYDAGGKLYFTWLNLFQDSTCSANQKNYDMQEILYWAYTTDGGSTWIREENDVVGKGVVPYVSGSPDYSNAYMFDKEWMAADLSDSKYSGNVWLRLIFWGLGIKFLDSKEKKFGISNPS